MSYGIRLEGLYAHRTGISPGESAHRPYRVPMGDPWQSQLAYSGHTGLPRKHTPNIGILSEIARAHLIPGMDYFSGNPDRVRLFGASFVVRLLLF